MIIILGFVAVLAVVVMGVAGVLSNGGGGHALTHPFAVFGYHMEVPPARSSSAVSKSG